jgi:hypothetical protein
MTSVLVLLVGVIYEVQRRDGVRWHDIHTTFYEDCFGNVSNIKVITSTILEAAVLVSLTGRIYDIYLWDDLRWHDKYIPSFMTIVSGIQVILRIFPQQLERLQCWYYWWRGFLKYAADIISGGMMYEHIPSLMTIGSGIRAILSALPQQFERL